MRNKVPDLKVPGLKVANLEGICALIRYLRELTSWCSPTVRVNTVRIGIAGVDLWTLHKARAVRGSNCGGSHATPSKQPSSQAAKQPSSQAAKHCEGLAAFLLFSVPP